MSASSSLMSGPIYYSNLWLILGILFFVVAIIIIIAIFYVTRKKEVKTISTLATLKPTVIDLSSLRQKYLSMISDVVKRYDRGELKSSEAHQKISLIVRRFFAESYGFRAEFLTLSDLKKSDKKTLTSAIERYYPEEFNLLEKGSVLNAARTANELISKEGIKNA